MTAIKKAPIKKVAILHSCTQAENIRRMNEILVGNGHPEDGLAFRFKEFMADHKRVLFDIDEIKNELKNVNENYNVLLSETTKIGLDLSTFKAAVTGRDTGRSESEVKAREKVRTIFIIIGGILTAGILISTLVIALLNHKYFSDNQGFSNEVKNAQKILDYDYSHGIKPAMRSIKTDTIK